MLQKLRKLVGLIGNTPLLQIDCTFQGQPRRIYAKAEYYNLTGSIKDRMAFHILWRAIEQGRLQPGGTIVEATSGNTGIAFSALGGLLDCPVVVFMPDWMSRERINLLQSFGAEVRLVNREEGGFLGSIRESEQFAAQTPGAFLPRQFSNHDNSEAHYLTTGPELFAQLQGCGVRPNAFVAGVGTGGTVMGVDRYLREKVPAVRAHPLEPSNSPTLSTGYRVGKHRIQGISDELIPAVLDLKQLDGIVSVDDGDAILMAQKLALYGLGVGISSGANFLGALKVHNEMGSEAVVTTVFADCSKKYLSTDLMLPEPVCPGMLAPEVEIMGVRAITLAAGQGCGCC
ncbi:MAG: cysteine synthase family protein [Burkholderiales bacterium]|jgi:cysteine synthase A|nr:cysteine synthase family protein [Burkholderiales bacterium]